MVFNQKKKLSVCWRVVSLDFHAEGRILTCVFEPVNIPSSDRQASVCRIVVFALQTFGNQSTFTLKRIKSIKLFDPVYYASFCLLPRNESEIDAHRKRGREHFTPCVVYQTIGTGCLVTENLLTHARVVYRVDDTTQAGVGTDVTDFEVDV